MKFFKKIMIEFMNKYIIKYRKNSSDRSRSKQKKDK